VTRILASIASETTSVGPINVRSETALMRRRVALVFLAVAAARAFAAEYPTKPVRIIAPFSAGGSVDLVARLLETDLGKPLGQQIVVDNRGGASGNIGTELAKNAAPDGYTLLVNTLPFVTNQFVYDKMPYDPINDFAPITLLCSVSSVLLSHPSVPVNSVKDLIALARSKPDALTYATAGPASNPHIAGELLKNMAKIKLLPVHYKGGPLIRTVSTAFEVVSGAPGTGCRRERNIPGPVRTHVRFCERSVQNERRDATALQQRRAPGAPLHAGEEAQGPRCHQRHAQRGRAADADHRGEPSGL
jgi:hypothetical protein